MVPPRYNLRKPKTPGTEEDKPADLRSEMMAAAAARAARSPGSLDTTESSDSRGGTTRPEHTPREKDFQPPRQEQGEGQPGDEEPPSGDSDDKPDDISKPPPSTILSTVLSQHLDRELGRQHYSFLTGFKEQNDNKLYYHRHIPAYLSLVRFVTTRLISKPPAMQILRGEITMAELKKNFALDEEKIFRFQTEVYNDFRDILHPK